MKVDGGIGGFDTAADLAKMQEEPGYDGLWTAETSHNPFYPLLLASQKTERIQLGTGIAVAFARNPMITAMDANDIQLASKGRHLLGLGSQIKPHIEKRFSMQWSHPARRMREYILALHAIWDAWNNKTKLPTVELYDLKNDLAEEHDLVAEQPEKVRELLAVMESAREPSEVFPSPFYDRVEE